MRKIILAGLLCLAGYASIAASAVVVRNTTNCDVRVVLFDYDATTCNVLTPVNPYSGVVVPAGGSVSIGIIPPYPAAPYEVGIEAYFIGCATPTVSTSFATTCYPDALPMPTCGTCDGKIAWIATGVVAIVP